MLSWKEARWSGATIAVPLLEVGTTEDEAAALFGVEGGRRWCNIWCIWWWCMWCIKWVVDVAVPPGWGEFGVEIVCGGGEEPASWVSAQLLLFVVVRVAPLLPFVPPLPKTAAAPASASSANSIDVGVRKGSLGEPISRNIFLIKPSQLSSISR